ncbi:MAG: RHS repeat-associated core domain-containing protein [Myxococcota bacterium]
MPRTAPVPNLPAIPGMNPGIFVMGGGGGGGGGSGKGGSGRGGDQGADGEGGGDGAEGGGGNAAQCGPGSGAGCPNPSHGGAGTAAGDPVDPISGRVYTTAERDLALSGPLPLLIDRSYSSSVADVDLGLGYGWSHSLGWTIVERRRTLRILQPGADATTVQRPQPGEGLRLRAGYLLRLDDGFALDRGENVLIFRERRGKRTYQLSRMVDRNGNAIALRYERGHLAEITDSVGRVIRVRRHQDGHIAAFEVRDDSQGGQWVSFRTYSYDEAGDLVAAIDALGHAERFTYDEHRLVKRVTRGGMEAHFVYRDQRCIESYCLRPGRDGLDADVPSVLADGRPARGFLHVRIEHLDDSAEVVDSRSLRRIHRGPYDQPTLFSWGQGVHSYRYDEAGALTEYVDAHGHGTFVRRDAAGRATMVQTPDGGAIHYDYDDAAGSTTMSGADGEERVFSYDDRGNLTEVRDSEGLVVGYTYDDRGLLVRAQTGDGAITQLAYDAHGNRTGVVEPDGASRNIRYDFFGRVVGFTDERGGDTSLAYDARGLLTKLHYPHGAAEYYAYDPEGQMVSYADADGRVTRMTWGGVGVVTEVVRPGGERVQYHYDREQDLVRIVDESGAECRFERDHTGHVIFEKTFDGRERHLRYDMMGHLVAVREANTLATFAYDACGRIVHRQFADGATEELTYDEAGRLAAITRDDVTLAFSYDGRGRLRREERHFEGQVETLEFTHGPTGRVVSMEGAGGRVETPRDAAGRPTGMRWNGEPVLDLHHDPLGRPAERRLAGGARVLFESGHEGRLERARVVKASASPRSPASPAGPDWVGEQLPGQTYGRQYEHSRAGLLAVELDEMTGQRRYYERDTNGRVLVVRGDDGHREERRYGPAGEPRSPALASVWEAGGRPLTEGDVALVYDAQGRRTERHDPKGTTRYEWSADHRLMACHAADEVEVRFVYDPLGRRIEKRVLEAGRETARIRYDWLGDTLLREVTHRHLGEETSTSEVRFLAPAEAATPVAAVTRQGGGVAQVRHLVNTPNGAVAAVVDPSGKVEHDVDLELFGRARGTTPFSLRLLGQQADDETGLHYNMARYYDPAFGTYLSPEPLGIEGGLRPYAYVDGYPAAYVDPDGRIRTILRDHDGNELTRASSGSGGTLHPAVEAALPRVPARSPHEDQPASACGEPRALSRLIRDYEEQNGVSCDPSTAEGRRNLGGALDQVGSITSETGTQQIPACPNCSQTIPRLWALAGRRPPRPSRVGGTSAPRNPAYGSSPSHRRANLSMTQRGVATELGVYDTNFNRIR